MLWLLMAITLVCSYFAVQNGNDLIVKFSLVAISFLLMCLVFSSYPSLSIWYGLVGGYFLGMGVESFSSIKGWRAVALCIFIWGCFSFLVYCKTLAGVLH